MLTVEQRIERMSGIGGSDLAAICGLSKWSNAVDIFHSKLELQPDIENSPLIEWGNRLEPVLREKASEILGVEITTPKDLFRSQNHDFMVANLDGWIENDRIVCEFKVADKWIAKQFGEEGSDYIPDQYLFQLAHYAVVMNAAKCYLFVLIGGNDFRQYTYERNPELEEHVIRIEKNFWENHVMKRIPPEPRTYDEASTLWPHSNEDSVVSEDAVYIHQKLLDVRSKLKELEDIEDKHKAELCKIIGSSSRLITMDQQTLATWKTQHTKRIDTNKLRSEYPEVARAVSKTTTSRVLRVS